VVIQTKIIKNFSYHQELSLRSIRFIPAVYEQAAKLPLDYFAFTNYKLSRWWYFRLLTSQSSCIKINRQNWLQPYQ